MLNLKKWERVDRTIGEHVISCEIKRLSYGEAQGPVQALMEGLAEVQGVDENTPLDAVAAAMKRFYAAVPGTLIAAAFRDFTRHWKGIAVDGIEIDTGEQAYEIADEQTVMWVLSYLRALSQLSVAEGKGSASSRTPSVAPSESSGQPAAPSTETAASPTPSTATETRPAT